MDRRAALRSLRQCNPDSEGVGELSPAHSGDANGCIDIQPYGTVQARERDDILNVGGFSDPVFGVISEFAGGELNAAHRVV